MGTRTGDQTNRGHTRPMALQERSRARQGGWCPRHETQGRTEEEDNGPAANGGGRTGGGRQILIGNKPGQSRINIGEVPEYWMLTIKASREAIHLQPRAEQTSNAATQPLMRRGHKS